MRSKLTSTASDSGFGSSKLLLSFCIQPLLLLAFLSKQFFDFDLIGLSNGFSHPLMGWDHLLTMLAVGIWAAQLRGKAIWMLPLAFVGVMSLGGLAGASGLSLPSVEGIIFLSCAVFSLLITHKVRFSAKINVMIVAFFAFFHGFAHGQEISASASLLSYTVGFMLATLLLHGAGILAAKLVTLTITCLLTALFSSAAMAKTSPAGIDDSNQATSADKVSHGTLAWFGSGHIEQADAYLALVKQRLRAEASAAEMVRQPFGFALPDAGYAPPENRSGKLQTASGDSGCSLSHTAAEYACTDWRDAVSLSPADTSPPGLGFRHYFPDINHTPGQHLLSNGVGLTSPPLASVPLPQVISSLGNSPVSSLQKLHLQSILTAIKLRNSRFVFACRSRAPDLAGGPAYSPPVNAGLFDVFTNFVPRDRWPRRVAAFNLFAGYRRQFTDYRFESSA